MSENVWGNPAFGSSYYANSPHSKHRGTPAYAVMLRSCAIATAPLRAVSGSFGRPSNLNHSEPQCRQRRGSSAAGSPCRRRLSRDTTRFMRGGEKIEQK
jgi:hypothetical protein